jgi:hypothetical protein
MPVPSTAALRRGVLAACVLHDIDLLPIPEAVVLTGTVAVAVPWRECVQALDGADPESAEGSNRLAAWLRARRFLADVTPADLIERVKPVGLPVGHVLHPGPGWCRHAVLGGAVELGLGVTGLDPAHPDEIGIMPPGCWAAAGTDPMPLWPFAAGYLVAMAHLAADRRTRTPQVPLRPMGRCDVVTLLCHPAFRIALSGPAGGMVAAGVPMRDRGWTELRRIDPAFIVSAAAATEPQQRGFARPLLITAEEVVMVPEGGRAASLDLRDSSPEKVWDRSVRYR